MHSPDEELSIEERRHNVRRAEQLLAAARDPNSRMMLAAQIFEDAFSREVPHDGVLNRAGYAMAGHARRATVPESADAPPVYEDAERAELAAQQYLAQNSARAAVIANNVRKMRALLWARHVFLELDDERAETLESAIREWFLCSLPELPRDVAGIEQCVQANARASWATLQRVKRERLMAQAAE